MSDSAIAGGAVDAALPGTDRIAAELRITARSTAKFDDVRMTWRVMTETVESPGQNLAFVRLWAEHLKIAERDRVFVVGEAGGRPVALLPLHRVRRFGLTMLTWFPGYHVGCNAPIVDAARLAAMIPEERRALWTRMMGAIEGGDLVYLPHVPEMAQFAEFGESIASDTLYRAEFTSWENANTRQRSKSRRKHDRQQGERLEALGRVEFEEIGNGEAAGPVLEIMFRQRAARFVAMGVADPFTAPGVKPFYLATAAKGSGVLVKLHVLKLDGEIVAVRYNVVHGARMFCLISSMSDDPKIQGGSPGKQCLLRVMQTVFEQGTLCFDMGAGFTDEKRHWCNVKIPVRQHYLPLTAKGRAVALGHRSWQTTRRRIKENPQLLAMAKKVRGVFVRGKAAPAKVDEAAE